MSFGELVIAEVIAFIISLAVAGLLTAFGVALGFWLLVLIVFLALNGIWVIVLNGGD